MALRQEGRARVAYNITVVYILSALCHFTRKNTRFRAPAFRPTQAPCNIHSASTMRFAATSSKTASNCDAKEDAKHIETASADYANTSPHPPHTHEVASIACRRHCTRKNTRFRSAAFPPTQAPHNIRAAITRRSATRESTIASNHARNTSNCYVL